ncbi:MAG TPA: glycine cleavage system aminomethyltransferase GcvT [Acholeplasmataceae bacterium]|jgi:aminomethyltransferase|nr:glycine cleavage system aminomethyltransferase GcvT [Acholeplasmataceae bacterium]HPX72017.1 glycine cleavage system aminomethyltransferase GcvT [Acholeplasmataceae bacterium]HQC31033.1 glycine cleavage system aminomethyltransferase GcvT [Acholeplasmataceae bacterium]
MSENIPFWLKTTPLYETLKAAGGQFVEYGGFFMPVNFEKGIIFEHQETRNNVTFFDISHMGKIFVTGNDATKFLNYVSTNNITKAKEYGMQYQVICHPDGGVIDDLMAYKYASDKILLICNAANTDTLYHYLLDAKEGYDVEINNLDKQVAAIAVQGPNSEKALEKHFKLNELKYMEFVDLNGFIVSRSGYTGEDGFEIYGSPEDIVKLTKDLLKEGIAPAGLGARDTLRFEAGLPLYGHEMADYISPVQAGMNFAIDFAKDDFVGKEALLKQKENLEEKIYGLELIDRGIARQGHEVFLEGKHIGFVTSGFMIPGTKNSYANALLQGKYKFGQEVEIEIRGKKIKAKVRRKKYL